MIYEGSGAQRFSPMPTPCTHDLCLRAVARRPRVRSGRRLFRRIPVALRSDKAAFTWHCGAPAWLSARDGQCHIRLRAMSFRSYSIKV
jgi:hypothetical protein